MSTTIEQHLLWTNTPDTVATATGWGFQLDWKKATETWTNPSVHARSMITRFVTLCRQSKTSTVST